MLINALCDFAGLSNQSLSNKSGAKFSLYNQTASQTSSSSKRGEDIISISKEATLGRAQIDSLSQEFGEDIVGRTVSYGEALKSDEVRNNYEKKSSELNNKFASLFREHNISTHDTISIEIDNSGDLEISGSNYATTQTKKILKANPEIKEELDALSHMSEFIQLSDLTSEYHKAYQRNPSSSTYDAYEELFESVGSGKYGIEYNNGETIEYSSDIKGNKINNWNAQVGYVSSPI